MEKARKRVLLVEDDGTLRALYTDFLETKGFAVDHAVEGNEGYEKVRQGGYDIVLVDILLPGLSGQEILKKLDKHPPIRPNGPIIMLTNQDQPEIIQECRDLGAAGVIIKSSIKPDQLIQHIHEYLGSNNQSEP